VDPTRKAASVAQLQELSERIEKRLGEFETKEPAETPDIASMVLGVQQLLDAKLDKALADIKATQIDLTPILSALRAQGAQIQDLMLSVSMLAQSLAAPVERTGVAQLSDGTQVNLKITDRKMQ
jgi:hypothetical protein